MENKVPLLEIKDLHVKIKTERGIVRALNGVSFSIDHGQVMGLIGETGSGKSITAKSILRILPRNARIPRGEICFKGKNLIDLGKSDLRAIRGGEIALIFQEPGASLNPVIKVGYQILEAILEHSKGITKDEAKNKMLQLLQKVDLPNPEQVSQNYPHQLSGGMQQRVVIATALASDPNLLIADEPTSALDVTVQANILDLIKKLGLTILFITHDFGVVAEICDRVAVMYAGRIVEEAQVGELFSNASHPYSKGLLKAMPQNTTSGGEFHTIPGIVPSLIDLDPVGCMFRDRCEFALDICSNETPTTIEIASGHKVNCWLYDGQD